MINQTNEMLTHQSYEDWSSIGNHSLHRQLERSHQQLETRRQWTSRPKDCFEAFSTLLWSHRSHHGYMSSSNSSPRRYLWVFTSNNISQDKLRVPLLNNCDRLYSGKFAHPRWSILRLCFRTCWLYRRSRSCLGFPTYLCSLPSLRTTRDALSAYTISSWTLMEVCDFISCSYSVVLLFFLTLAQMLSIRMRHCGRYRISPTMTASPYQLFTFFTTSEN